MKDKINKTEQLELFVPGRLCILGEHSDWAGTNRMMNSAIVPGCAIVTGIEQGIYASVEKNEYFIVESDLDCYRGERFECEMDTEKLRDTATKGGFFSYVAGVASYVNEHYRVKGIKVRITRMDLPIKSGLSSSAAICVLVARAFNKLYHLHLNTIGEMNIAYMGEQRTPSRCGRLDQACAYGVNPIYMTFDGNDISAKPLKVKKDMYWVVADLNAKKDTVKILADLNRCYPFAKDETEENVHRALGIENRIFVKEAAEYIENGETEKLGRLMIDYQKNFDKNVAPACPEELASPVLHSYLNDENIKEYTYGCKGVGSQGDGSVQFLAKDKENQLKLIEYLKNARGITAVPFTLHAQQKIKKAIIPVAGFGTRLFPITKTTKKCLLPIMDRDGIMKPALLIVLEQLDAAGIEEVCLVVGNGEQEEYSQLFKPLSREYYDKLSNEKKAYENLIEKIGKKVSYVVQEEPLGFGHAVYQCHEFVQDEPTLLILGDAIFKSFESDNCMVQMIKAYEQYGLPVISMQKVEKRDVVHYGIMHGQWNNKTESIMELDEIKEKPTIEYAEDYLRVGTGAGEENYYAVFGQYVLTKEVFDTLRENIEQNLLENGEIQLTAALEMVRNKIGMLGYVVNGESYDIGLPEKYYDTLIRFPSDEM